MNDRVNIFALADELGTNIGRVKKTANVSKYKVGSDICYSAEEAEVIRSLLLVELSAEASRDAEKESKLSAKESRKKAREDRPPVCIWNGLIPVSALQKLRSLTASMTTPERRITQGDVLSLALDALERDLASRAAPPVE